VVASLRADVPVGVFLSGGVKVAHREKRRSTVRAEVAKVDGCVHSIVHVDADAYEKALVRKAQSNDLICAWEQEISQQLLAEAASEQIKAVLVGDAADETHFGYSLLLNPERITSPSLMLEFLGTVPPRRTFMEEPADYFNYRYRTFAEKWGDSWKTEESQRLAMSCLIYHLWLPRLLHYGDIHLMAHLLEG